MAEISTLYADANGSKTALEIADSEAREKIGNLHVYTTFSELGLSSKCTTLDVYRAMDSNSMAILGTDTTAGISDLPETSGVLQIIKMSSSYRYAITFWKSSGGDSPVTKALWIATTNTALDELTWQEIALKYDVFGENWTTVSSFSDDTIIAATTSGCFPLRYKKAGNMVYLDGYIAVSSSYTGDESILVCNLPSGFRPTKGNVFFMAAASNYRFAQMQVLTSGNVRLGKVYDITSNSYYSGSVSWINMTFSFPID